ncbi:unnamed protein product [Phytomonas sp. EM1]|nr:unnamed protein product [Phytomonas sp. EM1]|eukprot:CCW62199.1 unnamed protein product [Phytomonas sp. isolate EM1]
MLTDEEQRLFNAVRKAQLNRNTATKILEWDPINGKQLISGSFIRVLIKLPLDFRPENYAIAYVKGTIEGQPYSGFSTDTRQETKIYLLAALPRSLAEVNGTQFQLNSVSNSRMNVDEFALWLQLSREEGSPLPTISDLNVTAERIRAYEIAHRSHISTRPMQLHGNNHVSVNPNNHTTVPPQSNSRQNELSPEQLQSMRSNVQRQSMLQHQQQYNRARLSSNTALPFPSPSNSQPNYTLNNLFSTSIGIGGGGRDTGGSRSPTREVGYGNRLHTAHRGSLPTSSPEPSLSAYVDSGILHNGLPGQPDGPHTADIPPLVPLSSFPVSGHVAAAGTSGDQHSSGACQSYSQPQLNTLQTKAAHQEETEGASLERALRQEIMNSLQQTCLLFPKDTSRYKLSQLRLVERDMIEYLQQVREEISGKQENCVVCMDHVPTVILLPCRHKVMCRLCAPSCRICPVCRSTIKEMFETTEI